MSKKWKLTQSRDSWKRKAIDRAKEGRAQRKETRRMRAERDQLKQKIAELEKKIVCANNKAMPATKAMTVSFALSLFLKARIGFRAVSRVLTLLREQLGLVKAPCTQTIINWVTRLSIVKTQTAFQEHKHGSPATGTLTQGSVWMLDLSIGLGTGKILSVLALDLKHHQQNDHAARLQDVACVAVSVATSWTGEAIATFLNEVMNGLGGAPDAFLKDGGTDLKKAVGLLREQGKSFATIDDISHKIANLFKHAYGEHPLFNTFISACGQASKNLKQTPLASLAPPKVSNKARFMNLHGLVAWADKILRHSPKGNAGNDSMLAKLRASIHQLPECKPFINQFLRDASPMLECQKILKNDGLNTKTYKACEKIIEVIPASSSIRKGFTEWAKEHLAIRSTLKQGRTGMPISTDAIESLFGVGKRFGTGQIKDADRIASRLPAFCGSLRSEDIQKVLSVSVAQQQAIMGGRASLIRQRREVLPNPGRLETLAHPPDQKHIRLMPSSADAKAVMLAG